MKSVEMTEETYAGIPADIEAFTVDDDARWFESQDIGCMPAVLATLKAFREGVSVTAVAVQDEKGEDLAALVLPVGGKAVVRIARTPVQAGGAAEWESSAPETVKVTPIGVSSAEVERLAEGAAVTVTATCGGQSDTVTVN